MAEIKAEKTKTLTSVKSLNDMAAQANADVSELTDTVSTIDGTVTTISSDISELQTDVEQSAKQEQTDWVTNNLSERLNFQDNEVSELQDKAANIEGRVSNIQQGVIVDTSVPSVTIKAGGQSVEIASDDIRIKEGTQTLATFGSNRMRVRNQYVTNYYPRLKWGDTYIGKLGWIARSNGHLSLKPVVGDED